MSDISIPLSSPAMGARLDAQLPVTINRAASPDTPLGLWATIGWGAAGIGALYLTYLLPIVLSAIAGSPVAMPPL